ncbi:MAG TPA: EamA family transporter [Janthinobacterium sp.]|nr:EamA family transporter [Janthinobacterium sp.]
MPLTVFALVLFAAALHATWNAVVKRGSDKLLTTVLVTACAALIALAALPLLPAPAPASRPYIAASALFQVLYFVLVARVYRVTDMSLAYPLMRGSAPLLVALASVLWIGEPLSPVAWLGLGLICAGVLSMAAGARGAAFGRYRRLNWRLGLIGGAGTLGSYGIALWAMTSAPVAVVAALRETAILFGAAIAALWFRERISAARVAAIVLIATGAAALRLA